MKKLYTFNTATYKATSFALTSRSQCFIPFWRKEEVILPPVSIIEFQNLQFYMRRRPKKCQFIISELCRVYIDVNVGPASAVFVAAEL